MKKIISLILSMSLAISSIAFTTAMAEDEGKTDRNIALLNKLGITTIPEQRANDVIARDEFTSLIVNYATGASFTPDTEAQSVFSDVKKNNKFVSYINAIYQMGYMEGPGDNLFDPSGNVTLQHIEYVILRALGYDTSKLSAVDIQQIVDINDLLDDVYIRDAASLTVGEVSAILVNALDATPYMNDYDFGDTTMLELKFGMFYTDGLFFSGNTEGYNNCIYVDGVKYDATVLPEYDDLNGATVRAFIYISSNELAFLDTQYFKNDYYKIEANDVISATADQIRFYDENGREERETISGCIAIYNGRRTTIDPSELVFTNGEIVLVGRNSEWKTILINKYDTLVVGSVIENTIYDYHDATFNHTFSSDTVFLYGNNEIAINELSNGDVLSVAYSKDGAKCTVYVSRDQVIGEVKSINDRYMQVGRQKLYRSDYFVDNATEPKAGSIITVLLDHKGRAVAIADTNTDSVKYAYFMKAFPGDDFEQAMLKVYTKEGEFKTLNLATRVLVNGTRLYSNTLGQPGAFTEAFKTKVTVDASGTKTYTVMNDYVRQVMGYKLNAVGEIVYIDTAIMGASENENCLDLVKNMVNEKYIAATTQFNGTYGVISGGSIFFVPDSQGNTFDASGNLDAAKRNSVDNDMFTVGTSSLGNDQRYDLAVYNVTEGGYAPVAVIDRKSAAGARAPKRYSTNFMAITEVLTAVNKSEEVSYEVTGYDRTGKKLVFTVDDPDGFLMTAGNPSTVPEPGDLISYELDYKGEISAIECVLDNSNPVAGYTTAGDGYDFYINYYAYSMDDNGIMYTDTPGDVSTIKVGSLLQVTYIIVYDSETKTVEKGTIDDINTYKEVLDDASRLAIFGHYGRPQTMVIYR